ncbi:cysteine desulfurase family protein [Peptoniphilus catoniae]|uniref:cysteine desulfurase family protein n=1 Tax=Peptoniphilus catoniae TaxID=1660341 RepID=UPI0010FDBC83|nr:cysteine desulfurase family protein [Peptoniphilus catoniae]
MIYLDNCATTKPRDEVVDIMIQSMREDFANPSSLHSFGQSVENKIEEARENVANLINADPSEIYFTSGGTESNNTALNGFINKNKRFGNEVITSSIEHSSIVEKLNKYKNEDYKVIEIGVDSKGNINTDEIYSKVNEKTILLSLIHVNNELGTIAPIAEITKKVKSINKNVLVHVDGVQSFGKIKIDIKDMNCDSYSLSGHKIYGPKGIGALYLKNGIQIEPLIKGGGQEKNMRSGTENVPGILGLGKAAKIMLENFEPEQTHILEIKKYLITKLNENISDFIINTPKHSSPYVLSVSIKGIRGEVLLHYLEQDEIYISTASACTSNGTHKSRVLEAIKLKPDYEEGTIRICLSYEINRNDIDIFIEKLKSYVNEIREIMKR